MSTSDNIVQFDPSDVLEYAGNDGSRWRLLLGAFVLHQAYGSGQIVDVDGSRGAVPTVTVLFPEVKTAQFIASGLGPDGKYGFEESHTIVSKLRDSIESRRQIEQDRILQIEERRILAEQRAREDEESRILAEQRAREAEETAEREESDRILGRIENKQTPLKSDEDIIFNLGIEDKVALACEKNWNETGNPIWAASASRWWRESGNSFRAVDVTGSSVKGRGRQSKQVWTSRAAACWDVGMLSEAREAIDEAIRLGRDEFSQRALLRINGALGDTQDLEINPATARNLGLDEGAIDYYLRQGLEAKSNSEEQIAGRRCMVERLMEIDSERFGWARQLVE